MCRNAGRRSSDALFGGTSGGRFPSRPDWPIMHAMDLDDLPGAELIRSGLRDLDRGVESVEALLVAVGAPRLRRLGIAVRALPDAEHRLYALLARSGPDDAHVRYNALLRRLVSFERAAECARRLHPSLVGLARP